VTVEEAVPSHLFLDDSEVKNTVEKICVSKNVSLSFKLLYWYRYPFKYAGITIWS